VTLVDSNILIDIWADDRDWYDWSLARLNEATRKGPLLINDIVYAETSIRFSNVEDFNTALAASKVNVLPMPSAALFLAGKAFTRYRNAGGPRTGVPPDFFIGAHAETLDIPILTRDVRRYRHYFPTVELIAPQG
jgi:predicted nucleic acid-binding protein